MIRVPKLNEDRVELNPTSTTRLNTQAPDFGDRSRQLVDQQVQGITQTALKIEQAEIEKANQVISMDLDLKLSELQTDLMYNKDSGALNKKGRDAFGTVDTVKMDWDLGVKELEKGLSNDRQKKLFRDNVNRRFSNINKSLKMHISKESLDFDNKTTQAYIANSKNEALENYYNSEAVDESVERQRAAIQAHVERNGLPSEVKKQMIESAQSETYAGVITRILDGGADLEASAYYQKNKHLLNAKDQRSIEKQLEVGNLLGETQRATDDIFLKGDDPKQALDRARKIKDPKLRAEVVRSVKNRISENRMLEQQDLKDNFDKAFEVVESTKSMSSIPSSIISKLSLQGKQALERRVQQLIAGKPVRTNLSTYYNLELMASSPKTRDKFLNKNLNELRDQLNDSDFKHFAKIQSDMVSGKGESNKFLDGIQTKSSIINETLNALEMPHGTRASAEENMRVSQFRRMIDSEVVKRQSDTGKKVSNEELRQIVDHFAKEVVVGKKYLFFDDTKRVFQVKANDIPDESYQKYSDILKSKGKAVTEDNILKLHIRVLKSQQAR